MKLTGVTLFSSSLLLTLTACFGKDGGVSTGSWPIDPVPLLTLGVEAGPAELEFARVSSALTLPTGVLVVANSGSSEIRFFSPNGAFLRSVGRRGEGPGDYSGAPLHLELVSPDTLLVFDTGNWRATRLDSVGRLETSMDLSRVEVLPFAWLPRVYPRAYVRVDQAPQVRPCVESLLPRLARTPALGLAALFHVDSLGYLWATPLPLTSETPTAWQVFDLAGSSVGNATLPAGFTPYLITRDRILGRLEDSLGVEHVVLLSLERGGGQALTCHSPAPAAAPPDSATVRSLVIGVRDVIQAQEAHYADHSTYTTRPDDLQLPNFPDARLIFVTADNRHWFGLVIDNATSTTCAAGVGYQPPGWREASPRCR